jgi:ankyrin repeat protein
VRHLLRTVPGAVAAKDVSGGTALPGAACDGRAEICRVLLAAGAQVDARADDDLGSRLEEMDIHGALGDFKVPKKIEFNMRMKCKTLGGFGGFGRF